MALQYQIIPVTSFAQNCTLLWCDETMQGALVDPGGDGARLLAAVQAAGVRISKLILPHGHIDHVGGTQQMAQHFGVEIEGPQQADAFWLNILPQQAMMFGFPPAAVFSPQRWLAHGDLVTVGKQQLEVRHCPGHTPGHVVLINHASRLALVGDVLFHGGIGRTDFPQGNHQQLLDAIQQQLFSLPDDYRFIPGHGEMSTIGWEKQHNPFVGKYG